MAETIITGDPVRIVSATAVILDAPAGTFPAASITNAAVSATAAIDATKLEHRHRITYAQPNTSAADETIVIYNAKAAGTVNAFSAGSIAIAVGAATCTFDLKKNGTTILSAVITIDSGNTNYVAEAGTISSAAYVAGDTFTVVIDGTAGGGTLPTGVFCVAEFEEAAA